MLKSYIEDAVFNRDTKRLLAYYRRVLPGSLHDGDEFGARHLVYKYRNKKDKLWKRLETKYGFPVPDKWDDSTGDTQNFEKSAVGNDEEIDLDSEEQSDVGEDNISADESGDAEL